MSNGTHSNHVIPAIPGLIVERKYQKHLQGVVADLLGSANSHRFLGAQPVSFATEHIDILKEQDYFVCEKSDGIRCLLFMRISEQGYPETFLIDRKNDFRILQDFHLPSLNPHSRYHNNTIIDGELILDIYEDGTTQLNFLCFDALIVEGKLLIERPYNKRLGYLGQNVIEPLKSMLKKHPELKRRHPFGVKIKNMQFGYNIDYILNHEAKQLGHKSDGLIFTSVGAPYVLGTCDTMLKWKPPCENSVDFRLNLESQGPSLKPKFLLSIWTGGNGYQLSSEMGVTDEEWIRFKRMPNLDNSIVEVVYDPDHCPPHRWKFLRFREDKPHANHISVLEKILKSIDDNIDTERLLNEAVEIRALWKSRPHPGL